MPDKISDEEFERLILPHETNKEVAFLRLQSLFNLSNKVSDNPELIPEFNSRIVDLASIKTSYEKAVSVICSLNKQHYPEKKVSYSDIITFDEIYYKIRHVEQTLKQKTVKLENSSRESKSHARPRLAKLEIFPFDSNLENWPTFRDTFTSLIHKNDDISDIEKFYYLLSALSGPALSSAKSMPITADNYPIVWSQLVSQYEDKRALATTYLDKLFNFKPLNTESVPGFNAFLQTYHESVKALEQLKLPDLAGVILFYLSFRNLDSVTRREFEKTVKKGEIPTLNDLIRFVEDQVRSLDRSECKPAKAVGSFKYTTNKSNTSQAPTGSKHQLNKTSQKTSLAASAVVNTADKGSKELNKSMECAVCNKPHSVYRCPEFSDLTPELRMQKVKQLKLCQNCLRRNHDLHACVSKMRCAICKDMHHHMLHIDSALAKSSESVPNATANPVALTCSANSTVLLGTAVIHVADSWGRYQPVRAVIDSGAMTGYLTQDCAKRLGLSRRKCNFEPVGIGGNPVRDFGSTTCTIKPRDSEAPILKTDAVIVSNIAGDLPTVPLSNDIINMYQNLKLADPHFYKPGPVDMLLAADVFPYIYDGQKVLPREHGNPVAMSSIFGHVISGPAVCNRDKRKDDSASTGTVDATIPAAPPTAAYGLLVTHTSIDKIMNSFWETENIQSDVPRNPEDLYVDKFFQAEHSRDDTGRYTVKYPFKPGFELGESCQQAERRLLNLEAKLDRFPDVKQEYHKFMTEYENLGHMTCLGELGTVDSKNIIPHFYILRPSSTTTKLRAVFDALCATSNGNSLNSVLYPGPKLQSDINEILINFRIHPIGLSADICKCYRQILIDKSQRPYQHILWRDSTDEPIKVFELNTVTYGVATSPYLAIKVLRTLADDEAERFPAAAEVLKKAFFMDDFLWSMPTVEGAIQLQEELTSLLHSGGFLLRKWSSNCPQVLEQLPEDSRELPVQFDDDANLTIKVLGLQWLPASDAFSFTTSPANPVVTKRTVLSQIGRQFDPLGIVAPCIFFGKCFMQKLWALKLDWDQSLPADLETQWQTYVEELPLLSNIQHERHATVAGYTYSQLLGFCDASQLGYAAVVYLRTENENGESKVSLLISKSKVAPLKTVTIPRLELLAAHLLAKLVAYVKSILTSRLQINETLLFTDSAVVLAWLNTPSYMLKTFVANRVESIADKEQIECWHHVSGACNPADVCSRGALPSALLAMPEWLHGPQWLAQDRSQWPVRTISEFRDESPPELKKPPTVLMSTDNVEPNLIIELTERFSSFSKLVNVVARCLLFIHNARSKPQERRSLSVIDTRKAHDVLVKAVQKHYFSDDLVALSKGNPCSQSIRKLNPFLDPLGFLRVGGRLSQSTLTFDKKHPFLLPKKSNFTNILIDHFHKLHLHVGPRTLQGIISQKYWIISARSAIRSRTLKCIPCFKVSPFQCQPLMGELPKFRTQDVHVFHTVGVDIGGPFLTKESKRRNAPASKSYLCVFVCCAVRAVHLEVLSSLSTECFLATFDRFTARRGLCKLVVSDNGTNFVAAGKQLKEISEFLSANEGELSTSLMARQVEWKHNPPAGSHFGGLYEAAIKSAKVHIKRAVGNHVLSFEELTTLFARVEAVLNSRPLCALSNDPSEFEVLTPSHFLIGRDLLNVPEYDLTDLQPNRLNRWQAVQQVAQLFWKRWRQDYLHTLQQRVKWCRNSQNLKVGDLVLVHADTPPLQWSLARISKIHPGPDGAVRVVTVRTKNKEFTRPVVKLSPLPLEQDSA